MTLDSAGLDALIADVEGASNESFRRDWLLLRLRYARSLAAAAPPTGENREDSFLTAGGCRVSADDCDRAGLSAAAHTLRLAAEYLDRNRPSFAVRRALQKLHDTGLLDVGTATGVALAAAQHATGENPYAGKAGALAVAWGEGFAAGRAAATPDPPCAHGLTGGRGAAERCFECGASVTAASPDERLREALALVYVMLTGAEPMWAEMPLDERCARAANEAQQAFLAADREAPDEAGRICCRGMGADGGCNICAAEATR